MRTSQSNQIRITCSTSEIPLVELPPTSEAVVPHVNVAGGLENIPEELLSNAEQLKDEMDHAGMDQQLPGEDESHMAQGTRVAPAT